MTTSQETRSSAPRARRGEVYENPVTGERAVVRVGTDETRGERLVVDLYVRPRGAVAAEHWHPAMHERFTVVSGRVAFTIDGREALAAPGQTIDIPPRVSHDWWNAGESEAHVIVEVQPADRFVACIRNMFGLAQERTDQRERSAEPAAARADRARVRGRHPVHASAPGRAATVVRGRGADCPVAGVPRELRRVSRASDAGDCRRFAAHFAGHLSELTLAI